MKTIIKIIVLLSIINCSHAFSQYYLGGSGDGYASDTSAVLFFCNIPVVTDQSSDLSCCTGDLIYLFVKSAGNGPFTYQWQEYDGTNWNNIYDNTIFSGTSSDTLYISCVNTLLNGKYFKCMVYNSCGDEKSNLILLSVYQSYNDTLTNTICEGDTFSLNGHNYTSSGLYSDTLTTINGCDSIITTNLIVNQLPQISISKSDVTCFGTSNGIAYANITGGTQPYTLTWSNGTVFLNNSNLNAGSYYLTVTDSNGCSNSNSITINQPEPMLIGITTLNAGCDSANGVVASYVSGGIPPYSFHWSNGGSTSIIQNLSANSYVLTVTDANQCEQSTIAYVNNDGSISLNIQNINDVSCYNGTDGAINITVVGDNVPFIYEWSNGASTQDISGIPAGSYEITVTDNSGCIVASNIEVSQPEEFISNITISNASCGNSDGSALIDLTGGTLPYNFLWSTSDTSNSITGLSAGTYSVAIYDSNNCVTVNNLAISNDNGPVISSANIASTSCNSANGSIDITISGGSMPFTFYWSNTTTNEDLTSVNAGDYTLTVTDSNGCLTIGGFTVLPQLPLENPLCIVLVDSILNKNKIVWEKVQTSGISHYNLYKETTATGLYQLLTSIPYNELSEYIDPYANPVIRPWRYRISAVDSCGNESPFSEAHKTLHLTVNLGLNQSVNLIWDKYEGFPYYSYYVYRHLDTGGWQILDTLPSTVWTYVDNPGTTGKFTYVVTVEKDFQCVSTGLDKTSGGPYSHSISNLDETSIPIAIAKLWSESDNGIIIYPNPASSRINIEFTNEVADSYILKIYNLTGQVILNKDNIKTNKLSVDIKNLNSGYYTIELKGKKIFRGKFLKR